MCWYNAPFWAGFVIRVGCWGCVDGLFDVLFGVFGF